MNSKIAGFGFISKLTFAVLSKVFGLQILILIPKSLIKTQKNTIPKNMFHQHKVFFTFLLKFLVCYFVAIMLYSFYLNQYHIQNNEVDGITHFVAQQTKNILVFSGDNCEIIKHEFEPSYKVFYNSVFITKVVEYFN